MKAKEHNSFPEKRHLTFSPTVTSSSTHVTSCPDGEIQRVVLRHGTRVKFESPLSASCGSLSDHLACLRRRSYAGKPSTPLAPTSFKRRDVDIQVRILIILITGDLIAYLVVR
jgi:hypothetical protein